MKQAVSHCDMGRFTLQNGPFRTRSLYEPLTKQNRKKKPRIYSRIVSQYHNTAHTYNVSLSTHPQCHDTYITLMPSRLFIYTDLLSINIFFLYFCKQE